MSRDYYYYLHLCYFVRYLDFRLRDPAPALLRSANLSREGSRSLPDISVFLRSRSTCSYRRPPVSLPEFQGRTRQQEPITES